ncbi:MAG: hypothetical protein GF400_09495 [Candidatus Eisenbacteria bacterium]|nr:hypothetical protein [Candidatus Eisenbacteria bacterium]
MVRVVTGILLVALVGLLLIEAAFSVQWRMVHDAPILMYMAFGMDQLGYVPYVDFFDMNAPGTHYFHLFVGRVFGYDGLGFRLADLASLAALLLLTWSFLRRFGRQVALCGAALFGVMYLGTGMNMSLQREYIVLLPVAAAAAVVTSRRRWPEAAKWLTVGALFGVAGVIKPGAAIGFPAVVCYGVWESAASARRYALTPGRVVASTPGRVVAFTPGRVIAYSLLGFALPVAAVALHLASLGALDDFLGIARGYWPLYTELSRTHEVVEGSTRAGYLAREWVKLGGLSIWLLPAVAGSFFALFRSELGASDRRRIALLAGLAVCYALYPLIGGKFWTYHWLPFAYFAAVLASLSLISRGPVRHLQWIPVGALVLAVAVGVRPPSELGAQVRGDDWLPREVHRADQIAGYLEENLLEGDTVQPLDWTGGALHAMLMAGAPVATRYVYDFHFYHHVSSAYIQELRKDFMDDLREARPRFIVRVETMRPWVSGEDTVRRYSALDRFIASEYRVARSGIGYTIHERRRGL